MTAWSSTVVEDDDLPPLHVLSAFVGSCLYRASVHGAPIASVKRETSIGETSKYTDQLLDLQSQ